MTQAAPDRQARMGRVEDAYARLKADIRDTRLPPGFRATEPEIALRLGMSRTPVREALLRLEAEGLIDLKPRKGLVVRPILASDMREIYEILMALEPDAAATIAARSLDERDFAPLAEASADMENALRASDRTAWATADGRFHIALMALNGNARMTAMVQSLLDQSHRARMTTLALRPPPVKSTEEHRAILEAMRRGDVTGARDLFRAHRARAARELLPLIQQRGADGV